MVFKTTQIRGFIYLTRLVSFSSKQDMQTSGNSDQN